MRKLFFAGIAALLASAAYGEKSVPTVTIKSPPAPPAKKTPGEPALRRLLTECPKLKDNTECQAVRDKIEYCVRRLHEASLQDYGAATAASLAGDATARVRLNGVTLP